MPILDDDIPDSELENDHHEFLPDPDSHDTETPHRTNFQNNAKSASEYLSANTCYWLAAEYENKAKERARYRPRS